MRLTRNEQLLLVQSLRNAEAYQHGLGDCYEAGAAEAKEAYAQSQKYRKLREKLSNELGIAIKNKLDKELESGELLSPREIHKRMKNKK